MTAAAGRAEPTGGFAPRVSRIACEPIPEGKDCRGGGGAPVRGSLQPHAFGLVSCGLLLLLPVAFDLPEAEPDQDEDE